MTSAAANVNGDAEGAYKPFLLQTPQTVRPASGRKILTCVSKVSKVASNAPEDIPGQGRLSTGGTRYECKIH